MSAKCLSFAALLAAVGCGSNSGNTPGGGGGGGAGGCTVQVSGDTASGVGSASLPCGYPKDFTTLVPPVEAVVALPEAEVDLTSAFATVPKAQLTLLHAGGTSVPVNTTLTEKDPLSEVSARFFYSASATGAKVWEALRTTAGPVGSFSLQVTSATATALGDCTTSVDLGSVSSITACYRVHGTAHAVLVPAVLTANSATGTVTVDWTF